MMSRRSQSCHTKSKPFAKAKAPKGQWRFRHCNTNRTAIAMCEHFHWMRCEMFVRRTRSALWMHVSCVMLLTMAAAAAAATARRRWTVYTSRAIYSQMAAKSKGNSPTATAWAVHKENELNWISDISHFFLFYVISKIYIWILWSRCASATCTAILKLCAYGDHSDHTLSHIY